VQAVGFRPRLLNCGWNVYNVTGQVRQRRLGLARFESAAKRCRRLRRVALRTIRLS
jgi:hypothetical protein